MQPPAEPRARNKMPLLPAEVIFAICRCFTVDQHDPAKDICVRPSTMDNIHTLLQLSLTCRAIHDVVTPTLYSSIHFTGPRIEPDLPVPTDRQNRGAESLVYFLRTILENSKLCQYVRDIACLIDLRDACYFEEEMKTANKNYGILSAILNCKDIQTKRLLDVAEVWVRRSHESKLGFEAAFGKNSHRPIISLSHQTFALIICLLPNVESLSLHIGSRGRSNALRYNSDDWKTIGTVEESGSSTTQHKLLQNLRTLQVQCDSQSPVPDSRPLQLSCVSVVPVLANASNLTHFRGYGCWKDLPGTVTSFENWGNVSDIPFFSSNPLRHLKSLVSHLGPSLHTLDFELDSLVYYLKKYAPALEHLEVSLSPGTHTRCEILPPELDLRGLVHLQSFFFDTHFISGRCWRSSGWLGPWSSRTTLPLNIKTLRLVDNEPRHDFDSIITWLQLITRIHLQPENLPKLKRIEYLHMSPSAVAHRNRGGWSPSKLASEVKQELALHGVQFQLYLISDEGSHFPGAEFPEHEATPTHAHMNIVV